MKIIIPIGPKDAENLAWLVRTIVVNGKVKQPIMLFSVPSQIDNALQAQKQLKAVCSKVELVDVESELNGKWPMGSNLMFHFIASYFFKSENNSPWLWLEPDCTVMRARWADSIEEEYKHANKPYFGFVRATRHDDGTGKIYFVPGDNMLLGVAVYSPRMLFDNEIVPLFESLGIEAPNAHPDQPWDLWLRWKFFKRGVCESPLIHDKWRTINYRMEGKTLVCDADPTSPTGTAVGGVIPDAAVIVHGCKDHSLQKLVVGENTLPVSEPVIEAKPGEAVNVMKAIRDIVEAGDKPRVGDIAVRVGMSSADVKPLIEQLGHTIGKAGWITLKTE